MEHSRTRILVLSAGALVLVGAIIAVVVVLLTRPGHHHPRPSAGPSTGSSSSPTATGSPEMHTCQEGGRQVPVGTPCGEPSGLRGLRFVFPSIAPSCVGSSLDTDRSWQYVCTDGATKVVYSTFKDNALLLAHNVDRFAAPPTTLVSGLLRFGPQQMPDGTIQVSLQYDGVHPFGVDVTSDDARRALEIANTVVVRAPSAFRSD